MKSSISLCTISFLVLFAIGSVHAQQKAEIEAINSLIDKYCETEDKGDLVSQAKLMTADRIWIGPEDLGRQTNQTMNMEIQQAQIDEVKKLVPGAKWFTDARDRIIKLYGNGTVAVASFYWYRTLVLPADTPPEKANLISPPIPMVMTQVLSKEGGDWKIVHTHVSFFSSSPSGQ